MAKSILRYWLLSLTPGLLAVVALAACSGDDPAPDAAPPANATTAADESETAEAGTGQRTTATLTADDEQTGSSASDAADDTDEEASAPAADDSADAAAADASTTSELTLDRNTSWQDVFETLTASEQACLLDLGDEVPALLSRKVLRDEATEDWESDFFACLDPETGRDLLLGSMIVGMAEEGLEVSAAEAACLREALADLDPATFVASTEDEGPEVNAFVGEVWRCMPELFFESIAGEIGVDLAMVSEPELACMQEWARDLDVAALLDAMSEGDLTVLVDLTFGLYRCSPSLLLASFGNVGAELDPDAEACIRELMDDAEGAVLLDPTSEEYTRFYAGLLVCVPALPAPPDATGAVRAGSGSPDDHADFFDGATVVAVGVQVSGELGSADDLDYFVFEAEQGIVYEVSIRLVTLEDSALVLYDAEWRELAFNDDYADTYASRIYWLADYSGDHYIEVWGFGLGTYTMVVEER